MLRALWPALDERLDGRRHSVDLEEAWLILAGFLLRPGFGVVHDDLRIDALWRLHDAGACFPGRRIKCQEYILWRRVAGGLTRERQNKLLAGELDRIRSGKAPAELVRLAGSLELIPHATKAELVSSFIDIAVNACARQASTALLILQHSGSCSTELRSTPGQKPSFRPTSSSTRTPPSGGFDWADPELVGTADSCSFGPRASSAIGAWTCPGRCAN